MILDKELHEYMPRTLEITAMEELAECSQAISKVFRYGLTENTRENLLEELTDAYIMMNLVERKYNISLKEISSVMDIKLSRLKKRIIADQDSLEGSKL